MKRKSIYPRFLVNGSDGILVEFAGEISQTANDQVRKLMDSLRGLPFIVEMIPAFASLLILFEPGLIRRKHLIWLIKAMLRRNRRKKNTTSYQVHEIPVLYDGEDLSYVAQHAGISEKEVIRLHTKPEYPIYMLGFLPGFAYLGGLEPKLHTPRLSSPRTLIPAGSVGIGGEQTGIYPMDSPGGWQLIGRTPLRPYLPDRKPAFLYKMGDHIRFRSITKEEYERIESEEAAKLPSNEENTALSASQGLLNAKGITVLTHGLSMTVQDKGRYGYQALGFSVSGCMDQKAYQDGNQLVGNTDGEAVIEMLYLGGSFRFEKDTLIALTGADMQPQINSQPIPMYEAISVHAGDILTLKVSVKGRYGYLAVKGGIDAPVIMNSRSTNTKCKIGGFEGRSLKAGDVLPIGDPDKENRTLPGTTAAHKPSSDYIHGHGETVTLRVLLGPQDFKFSEDGIHTFFSETYTISPQSDRMGYRLEGPSIESISGVDILSDGTNFGSIQVPSSGKPILLLADRQTTGGYAKIGAVIREDLPSLVQCMPGQKLRFVPCTKKEAR